MLGPIVRIYFLICVIGAANCAATSNRSVPHTSVGLRKLFTPYHQKNIQAYLLLSAALLFSSTSDNVWILKPENMLMTILQSLDTT